MVVNWSKESRDYQKLVWHMVNHHQFDWAKLGEDLGPSVKMKSVKEQVTTMKKSDPDTMAPTPVGGTPKKTSTASGTRKKTPAPKKANAPKKRKLEDRDEEDEHRSPTFKKEASEETDAHPAPSGV